MTARWTRDDYALPADQLAPALLGQRLVHVVRGARRAGIIVETEAYLGPDDLASHAAGGRRTARTEPMWGEPGFAYVYISYGLHRCMNVVGGSTRNAHAVLIRALEPVEGLPAMRRARTRPGAVNPLTDRDLASGPGKLCQALAITEARSGADMTAHDRLFIEHAEAPEPARIARAPRIGLGDAGDWTNAPLRWLLAGNPHISRPAPQARNI
jgi:DNA-3-methyladenine glycosylase